MNAILTIALTCLITLTILGFYFILPYLHGEIMGVITEGSQESVVTPGAIRTWISRPARDKDLVDIAASTKFVTDVIDRFILGAEFGEIFKAVEYIA